jgi:hypothetical protein
MANEPYLFKTQPGYICIAVGIIGAGFSSFLAHSMWVSSWNNVQGTDLQTAHIIELIFLGLLVLFSAVCLYLVISFKIIYVTHNELIITRPLFFYKRDILLVDIKTITEEDENISISRGFSYEKMKIGKKAAVQLKNRKSIKISSIEIWGYNTLIKKLHSELRRA